MAPLCGREATSDCRVAIEGVHRSRALFASLFSDPFSPLSDAHRRHVFDVRAVARYQATIGELQAELKQAKGES